MRAERWLWTDSRAKALRGFAFAGAPLCNGSEAAAGTSRCRAQATLSFGAGAVAHKLGP